MSVSFDAILDTIILDSKKETIYMSCYPSFFSSCHVCNDTCHVNGPNHVTEFLPLTKVDANWAFQFKVE